MLLGMQTQLIMITSLPVTAQMPLQNWESGPLGKHTGLVVIKCKFVIVHVPAFPGWRCQLCRAPYPAFHRTSPVHFTFACNSGTILPHHNTAHPNPPYPIPLHPPHSDMVVSDSARSTMCSGWNSHWLLPLSRQASRWACR